MYSNLLHTIQNTWFSKIIFLATLAIVVLSLLSVIFPSLIASVTSPYENSLSPYEIGPWATSFLVSNVIIFGIGFAYYKKKLPIVLSSSIQHLLNFEISRRTALISTIILLSAYIGFSIQELSLNEAEQWPDYEIIYESLKIWPSGESEDIYIQEFASRHVKMSLLYISINVFGNIKILPFIASILLVIFTYLLTYQISHKRFASVISMVVLLQSYTFLKYDTLAVYDNFWILFYVISLYAVYKKWYISPIALILSVFTKPYVLLFVPMNIFYLYRAKMNKKEKIPTLISYAILVVISSSLFFIGESVYGPLLNLDFSEFWMGFTAWAHQLRFDSLMILFILPVVIGLFIKSRRGVKEADSILFLILGALLVGPVLVLITDFVYIFPYRFLPLIVFFAIGIGVLLTKELSLEQNEIQSKLQ